MPKRTAYGGNDKVMKNALLYLWQLPQCLLGLLLRAIYKGKDSTYNGVLVRRSTAMKGGISLGKYIILNQWANKTALAHEYGHCKQSMRLGWLYLFVVGIPSLIHAFLCPCKNHSYYSFYTERWADKLMDIKRY